MASGGTVETVYPKALIATVPHKIHKVLTDNGPVHLAAAYADGLTARYVTYMFDMRHQENGIEHRLTKIKHPWTNGQVERMNRTIICCRPRLAVTLFWFLVDSQGCA